MNSCGCPCLFTAKSCEFCVRNPNHKKDDNLYETSPINFDNNLFTSEIIFDKNDDIFSTEIHLLE